MMKLAILYMFVPWLLTLRLFQKLRYSNLGSSCPEKITDSSKIEKALENAGKKEKPKDTKWSMKFKSLNLKIYNFKRKLVYLEKIKIKLIVPVKAMT